MGQIRVEMDGHFMKIMNVGAAIGISTKGISLHKVPVARNVYSLGAKLYPFGCHVLVV